MRKINCVNPLVHFLDENFLQKIKSMTHKTIKQYAFYNSFSPSVRDLISLMSWQNKVELFPCRKCSVCLLTKRADWVKRAMIELQYWKHAYFLTLTFDNDHLTNPFFENRFFSKWVKYDLKPALNNEPLSYLATAEYGSHTHRKHYHMILFTNYEFEDWQLIKRTKKGKYIYLAEEIKNAWPYGFTSIAVVDSVAVFKYCVSYSTKELEGKNNINIPSPYLGEHLIVSRGFGDTLSFNENLKEIPNSLINNAKCRLRNAEKKLKLNKITKQQFKEIWLKNLPYLEIGEKRKKVIREMLWNSDLYDSNKEALKYISNFRGKDLKGEL